MSNQIKKVEREYFSQQLLPNGVKTYRLSDNSPEGEVFETNSYYELHDKIEELVTGKDEDFVAFTLDRTTNLEKRYRWISETNNWFQNAQANSIYNY